MKNGRGIIYINLKISCLYIFILLICFEVSSAQIFDRSQNPPSIKWKQINTENFQLIYPETMEREGQRMANVVESIIGKVVGAYHIKPHKISIILQNQGTTANGFVQLAPRRSEFFTTPSQEFDYQDWLNSLAVHELRHVVQFDKLTGKLRPPFESLGLAIFGIILPPWFYEGDAVITETALTEAGRGRQPEFDLVLRTNTLSGRMFSYSKDYLGSVKDFPPGYYTLGYYMTAKLRRDHGPAIMDDIFTRIARNPLRPYNLSSSIKKFSGMNTRQLHDATIAELSQKWKMQQETAAVQRYRTITKRSNTTPVNYLMPVRVSPNKIAALKHGTAHVRTLILTDILGNEEKLLKIGSQENDYFRYAAGKFVWDEFRYDARFQKRSYNVIMTYDQSSGVKKQLTHRTRLFSPNLSPDGKTILAVSISYGNDIALVELDENGSETKRYASPGNVMLQTPSFNAAGDQVVVTAVSDKGKAIMQLDRTTGIFRTLLPFQRQLISMPAFMNDTIVYKAHYAGIDNLYQLDPANGEISQLTSVRFGAYNPSWDASTRTILFNEYQANGHDVAIISPERIKKGNVKRDESAGIAYFKPLSDQETDKDVFDSIPTQKFDTKAFHELSNLFYFHSLLPIAEENDYFNDNNYGLKLQSDNKLNTLSLYAGYRFNNALRRSEYLAGFTYSRYFPVFDVRYVNQARYNTVRRTIGNTPTVIPVNWREHVWEAEVTVPVVFNRLNQVYSFSAEAGTSYVTRYDFDNRPSNVITTLRFPMFYRFNAGRNQLRSARDLAPAWGQNISLLYRHFPFEDKLSGNLFTFRSAFYFPGLLLHHSLQTSFNYQQSSGNYALTTDIPRVSGYANLKRPSYVHNTFLVDYRFPLFYPDWELGPLAYIKRFTAGFFTDFENIGHSPISSPRTFGAELRADMNILRFYLPNFAVSGKVIFVNEKPRQNPIFEAGITYSY